MFERIGSSEGGAGSTTSRTAAMASLKSSNFRPPASAYQPTSCSACVTNLE